MPIDVNLWGRAAAEFWLLKSTNDDITVTPRVHDLHLSNVDHYGENYPREKYELK
jgi:hypothetical protein